MGGACAKEEVWPQPPFGVLEVHHEVSSILVGVEAEHLQVGASACGLGQGVGLVVIHMNSTAVYLRIE